MAKNESSENYLEAILMLSKKLPVVRSVDIANELGFKKIKRQHRHEETSSGESYYRNRCRFYLSDRFRKRDREHDL